VRLNFGVQPKCRCREPFKNCVERVFTPPIFEWGGTKWSRSPEPLLRRREIRFLTFGNEPDKGKQSEVIKSGFPAFEEGDFS
jgi:hypothetical protein